MPGLSMGRPAQGPGETDHNGSQPVLLPLKDCDLASDRDHTQPGLRHGQNPQGAGKGG